MKNEDKKFSFVIGRRWYPKGTDTSICAYSYGADVHYGTIKDAKQLKKYAEMREEGKKKYKIYKLVEV